MKRFIALFLLLALCLSLCACGKSPAVKNVEALIDGIGEVTVEKESAVLAAEEAYNALTAEEKVKVKNYDTLTTAKYTLFINGVNTINETDDSFAATVSAFFSKYDTLPTEKAENQDVMTAYNLLLEHYGTLYSRLADCITEINTHLDACEMEQVYRKCDDAIALANQLGEIPVTADIDEVNKRFELSSISEIIALMEESKDNVISLCYTDTFVMRFEYHEDFPLNYIEPGENSYSYGYTKSSYLNTHYNSYISYLNNNFPILSSDDNEIIYDIGEDKQLKVFKFQIPNWDTYCVLVFPPVVD